eukprot:1084097-Lingulodinium_polyedra.AAC.1
MRLRHLAISPDRAFPAKRYKTRSTLSSVCPVGGLRSSPASRALSDSCPGSLLAGGPAARPPAGAGIHECLHSYMGTLGLKHFPHTCSKGHFPLAEHFSLGLLKA